MNQPLAPSVRVLLAEALAMLDPRCGVEEHNLIRTRITCPACHLDLSSYARALDAVSWPSS